MYVGKINVLRNRNENNELYGREKMCRTERLITEMCGIEKGILRKRTEKNGALLNRKKKSLR